MYIHLDMYTPIHITKQETSSHASFTETKRGWATSFSTKLIWRCSSLCCPCFLSTAFTPALTQALILTPAPENCSAIHLKTETKSITKIIISNSAPALLVSQCGAVVFSQYRENVLFNLGLELKSVRFASSPWEILSVIMLHKEHDCCPGDSGVTLYY